MKSELRGTIKLRKPLKVALVCDWLTVFGGAEKVLWQFHEFFPEAPIYTTIYNQEKAGVFRQAKVIPSHLQKYPFAKNHHPWYIPLMPQAIERLNLRGYDLVISSSSTVAKAVLTDPETIHICYCHTPLRYAWQPYLDERGQGGWCFNLLLSYLRLWDKVTADRVDYFLANSQNVAERIRKFYRRKAQVLYPPVEIDFFVPGKKARKNYFLYVSRLIKYKKPDLIVKVFNKLQIPLKIVGSGPMLGSLKKEASENIEFFESVSPEKLRQLYQEAKAVIFPAEEDFGIVMVEALSCGTPVIAFGKGGALEIIKAGKTGDFFTDQSQAAIEKAILSFNPNKYDPQILREAVTKFSLTNFKNNFEKILSKILKERKKDGNL